MRFIPVNRRVIGIMYAIGPYSRDSTAYPKEPQPTSAIGLKRLRTLHHVEFVDSEHRVLEGHIDDGTAQHTVCWTCPE